MANKAAEQLAIIAYDKKIEKVSDDLRQEVEKNNQGIYSKPHNSNDG